MWIKTHEGLLVNTDRCEAIHSTDITSPFIVRASMPDENNVLRLGSYASHIEARQVLGEILKAIDSGVPSFEMPAFKEGVN
jgi:hypothetical protein